MARVYRSAVELLKSAYFLVIPGGSLADKRPKELKKIIDPGDRARIMRDLRWGVRSGRSLTIRIK
jgi:hypothetical protein